MLTPDPGPGFAPAPAPAPYEIESSAGIRDLSSRSALKVESSLVETTRNVPGAWQTSRRHLLIIKHVVSRKKQKRI